MKITARFNSPPDSIYSVSEAAFGRRPLSPVLSIIFYRGKAEFHRAANERLARRISFEECLPTRRDNGRARLDSTRRPRRETRRVPPIAREPRSPRRCSASHAGYARRLERTRDRKPPDRTKPKKRPLPTTESTDFAKPRPINGPLVKALASPLEEKKDYLRATSRRALSREHRNRVHGHAGCAALFAGASNNFRRVSAERASERAS